MFEKPVGQSVSCLQEHEEQQEAEKGENVERENRCNCLNRYQITAADGMKQMCLEKKCRQCSLMFHNGFKAFKRQIFCINLIET